MTPYRMISARILGLLLATTVTARAQSIHEMNRRAMEAYSQETAESAPVLAQSSSDLPFGAGASEIYAFKSKSPARAFAYSLIIPGMGQFYTQHKLKAFIFLGVEALGWAGVVYFDSKGDSRTADFEGYANAHWDQEPYWDSLKSVHNIDRWQDENYYPHHLPYTVEGTDTVVNKNHEYYENIGKYDQFIWGWDDLARYRTGADPDELNYQSNNRQIYVAMRADANKQYDRSTASLIVVIANHLISAFDAALSARSYNRQAEQASRFDVDVKMVNLDNAPRPWVKLAYHF